MALAPRTTRSSGVTLLLGGSAVTLVLGGLIALVGWGVHGAAAGFGALVGTALVVLVYGFGTVVVQAVTSMRPSASLLVAMLTYTLQLLVLLAAFVALQNSGLLAGDLDRRWVGGSVVAATVGWLTTQVWIAIHARVPTYDVPTRAGQG